MSPKVIVVFPVYNGAKHLLRSLECIAAQTFRDFEAVICENQSTDDTLEIAEAFCAKDPRFRVHQFDTHVGPIENFQRSLALVRGRSDFVCLRAHDDLSSLNFLEKLVQVLEAEPTKLMAACDSWRITQDGEVEILKPEARALDYPKHLRAWRPPSRLRFPSDWFYMLYRNEAGLDIVHKRLGELSVVWCVASYVVAEFVFRGKVVYATGAHFEFYRGSASVEKYKPKGFFAQLSARWEYYVGCYRVWPRIGSLGLLSRILVARTAWRDSGVKTGYRLPSLFKRSK